MSDYYRSLDSQTFNQPGSSSTWINLGLWNPTAVAVGDYAQACKNMAMAVGKAARYVPYLPGNDMLYIMSAR